MISFRYLCDNTFNAFLGINKLFIRSWRSGLQDFILHIALGSSGRAEASDGLDSHLDGLGCRTDVPRDLAPVRQQNKLLRDKGIDRFAAN